MSKLGKVATLAALTVALSGYASGPARAAITVIGGDFAQACYLAAKRVVATPESVDDCTRAINGELLSTHDLAGTYVNRGALYLVMMHYETAQHDFEMALMLEPTLGEGYVDLGAALIGQHHSKDGVADITKGLSLGSSEPEKAYYNRALGYEAMGDVKAAYYDYMKAVELKPDWNEPRTELVRFKVQAR